MKNKYALVIEVGSLKEDAILSWFTDRYPNLINYLNHNPRYKFAVSEFLRSLIKNYQMSAYNRWSTFCKLADDPSVTPNSFDFFEIGCAGRWEGELETWQNTHPKSAIATFYSRCIYRQRSQAKIFLEIVESNRTKRDAVIRGCLSESSSENDWYQLLYDIISWFYDSISLSYDFCDSWDFTKKQISSALVCISDSRVDGCRREFVRAAELSLLCHTAAASLKLGHTASAGKSLKKAKKIFDDLREDKSKGTDLIFARYFYVLGGYMLKLHRPEVAIENWYECYYQYEFPERSLNSKLDPERISFLVDYSNLLFVEGSHAKIETLADDYNFYRKSATEWPSASMCMARLYSVNSFPFGFLKY